MAKFLIRLLVYLLMARAGAVFAAGCVMCKQSAAAAPSVQKFNFAILLLLLPPLTLFLAIIALLWYYQRASARAEVERPVHNACAQETADL
jgi:hypothetical protein